MLNVFLIAGFNMGAMGMFIATVLAQIITCIYLLVSTKVWRYIRIKYYQKELLREISRYSLPLVPNQLCWWIIGASDRTIITYAIGSAANGVYSLANKFSSIYSTVYSIFNMSWTESVSVHINEEDRDIFLTETINATFTLFATADFCIIAIIPFIFPFMVNIEYQEAYYQIPILMIAVLFQIVVGLYSVVYIALKKSKEITKTSSYAAIINLVFNMIFVEKIGLYAASLSTLIAFMLMAFYRYFHVKKYIEIKLKKLTIINIIAMGTIVIMSYYYNHLFINIIVLLLSVVCFFCSNRNVLYNAMGMVREKFQCKK